EERGDLVISVADNRRSRQDACAWRHVGSPVVQITVHVVRHLHEGIASGGLRRRQDTESNASAIEEPLARGEAREAVKLAAGLPERCRPQYGEVVGQELASMPCRGIER